MFLNLQETRPFQNAASNRKKSYGISHKNLLAIASLEGEGGVEMKAKDLPEEAKVLEGGSGWSSVGA